MSEWRGTIDFDPTPLRLREMKEGDRILVRIHDGDDYVMVVDEVSEPDADGVIRATAHAEGQP